MHSKVSVSSIIEKKSPVYMCRCQIAVSEHLTLIKQCRAFGLRHLAILGTQETGLVTFLSSLINYPASLPYLTTHKSVYSV